MEQQLIQELKQSLEKEQARLQEELSSFAKKDPKVEGDWDSRYPRVPEGGIESAADEVEEYETRLEVEHNLERQLRAVNEALKRMEQGAYGVCTQCSQEIKEDRLRAYPEAALCESCAEKSS